jgi:hypothetical protein
MNGEILIPIFLFGGTAAVLWKYFEGRHKERMAIIEKGLKLSDFKSSSPLRLWQGNVLSNLKWGLLFTFVGIGLLIGLQLRDLFGFHEGSTIFSCMLISGGIALIVFYIIAAKKLKEKSPGER